MVVQLALNGWWQVAHLVVRFGEVLADTAAGAAPANLRLVVSLRIGGEVGTPNSRYVWGRGRIVDGGEWIDLAMRIGITHTGIAGRREDGDVLLYSAGIKVLEVTEHL